MIKKKLLIIVIAFTSICVNAQKLDGFFRYYQLSSSMRLAFEDYLTTNGPICSEIFIVDINSSDSTKIIFEEGNFSVLLTNPPMYFSCYRNKILFIYTGKEKNYYPSKLDLSKMYDFVNGVVDQCEFEIVNWENYTFRFIGYKPQHICNGADDKFKYLYEIKGDTFIKKPTLGFVIKAYMQLRFIPKIIK